MKSAKKKPMESDEPGPLKHAPRPKFALLRPYEIWQMAHDWWGNVSAPPYMYSCRPCGHNITNHVRGWCMDCSHECGGVDALHSALMESMPAIQRALDKHANRRK